VGCLQRWGSWGERAKDISLPHSLKKCPVCRMVCLQNICGPETFERLEPKNRYSQGTFEPKMAITWTSTQFKLQCWISILALHHLQLAVVENGGDCWPTMAWNSEHIPHVSHVVCLKRLTRVSSQLHACNIGIKNFYLRNVSAAVIQKHEFSYMKLAQFVGWQRSTFQNASFRY